MKPVHPLVVHFPIALLALSVAADLSAFFAHSDSLGVQTIYQQPALSVSATYLDCGLLTMALAIFQGWLGGELVYSDGVFVKRAVPTAGAKGEGDPHDEEGHHHH